MAKAQDLTIYKRENERPKWLNPPNFKSTSSFNSNHQNGKTSIKQKNGTYSTPKRRNTKKDPLIISQEQYTKIMSLIDTLNKKEINKIFEYGLEIKLSDMQMRELKAYFNLLKEEDLHINKYLESVFKVICILPISVYGTYVVYFKHDFLMNHYKQWINQGDDPNDPEHMFRCKLNHENEPLTQIYDSWMKWYYIISLGITS